ncbi:MAG: aspartate aminotransferase [Candidatus Marinimicrobia bacterium]|nr:aspartate aminotransferase [Candidatus Neomarinimicrobiota bacterium]|tara:strand:+ start:3805 stop:4914 length:1110 start_codon:yes stop_codon:yes gene_type:complete
MIFEIFELERNQSLYENEVDYNLSESGVHPLSLSEILTKEEQQEILNMEQYYGYTNGSPMLRERIAEMYGQSFSIRNVLITSGSAEANFLSVMTQLEPGDELIYMVPNYPQIYGLARSFGITVKELPIRQELGWQWDLDELKAMITKNTKMIAVCNPNNPTGTIMSDEVMDGVIKLSKDINCWLLSDEVYRGAELNGVECRTLAGATDKTVVNAGLSKAYSLPGLRLGWSIGSEEYINRAWSFHDYTVINVAYLSDWIASRIMTYDRRMKILNRTKSHLIHNLDLLCDWEKNVPELTLTRPQAAAIAFARLNIDMHSEDFVYKLRDNHSVLLTAGKWHRLEGFVRIGYGTPEEYVKNALNRITKFLEEL